MIHVAVKNIEYEEITQSALPQLGAYKFQILCTYVAFPSRMKTQDSVNSSDADTTFFETGLNLNLSSV